MSPLLTEVVEVGQRSLARKAQPWNIRPPDFFAGPEAARAAFARLAGCDPDGVAIVPAASYGIATAAANLPLKPGDRILLLADQFPSNVYPGAAAPPTPAPRSLPSTPLMAT
jgi:hypothetical protein